MGVDDRFRDAPQPLPLHERVYPPRPLDAWAPPLHDDLPAPATWSRQRAGLSWPSRRRGPRRKNVVLAGALGLLFGPIGMLYASVAAAIAAVLVGCVVFTLTLVLGMALSGDVGSTLVVLFLQALLAGPVCGAWAAAAAAWRNRQRSPAEPWSRSSGIGRAGL